MNKNRLCVLAQVGAIHKLPLLLLVMALIVLPLFAEPPLIYSQVRVPWNYIARVDNEIVYARPGLWAEFALSERELFTLDCRGVPYEVVVPDLAEFYASRLAATGMGIERGRDMGGWRTYAMFLAALDSLHNAYPAYVSEPESIGAGHNGNALWVVKISDNVALDEDEPELLIAGGIHAREVIAPEIVLSFAQWLMATYGSDEVATYLVNNREIWILPLINPDGYRYNEIMNPSGGGMWRKNRRDNGDGTYGVDLNRNFPYMWGYDDIGSSPEPGNDTYRGPSAASEPETQAMIAFTNSHEFRSSLSFHSYGMLYLSPWGYDTVFCPDDDWFVRIGYRYARNNGYIYGPCATTIYPTNGDTDDWFYGETAVRDKILAFTPEVGGFGDGFWPPLSRRDSLVAENMPACIICSQIAGGAPFLSSIWIMDSTGDTSGYADPGETVKLGIGLENLGCEPSLAYVLVTAVSPGLDVLTDTAWVGLIPSQAYDTVYAELFLSPLSFDVGDEVRLRFEVRDTNGYKALDSSYFYCGTPTILSYYDFESGDGGFSPATGDWEWGVPGAGPPRAYSGEQVWATNLDAPYRDSTESVLTLPPVAIPDSAQVVRLSFAHWYFFEMPSDGEVWDGGTVKISSNGRSGWNVISPIGGYDGQASEYNPFVGGDSVFTAVSAGWRIENFDLTSYRGETVQVALILGSDRYVNNLGWYIDDVAFLYYGETEVSLSEKYGKKPEKLTLEAYPNPFNATCRLDINGMDCSSIVDIEIYNLSGRLVKSLVAERGMEGHRAIIWDGHDDTGASLPTGIYLVSVRGRESSNVMKLLLIE